MYFEALFGECIEVFGEYVDPSRVEDGVTFEVVAQAAEGEDFVGNHLAVTWLVGVAKCLYQGTCRLDSYGSLAAFGLFFDFAGGGVVDFFHTSDKFWYSDYSGYSGDSDYRGG